MSIVSASASPSASATAVPGTPAAAAANDAQPACPKKRPSRLLRNALASISKYCEPCVPQPFPHVDLSAQPDCDMGIYIDSALTESGEAMLRQGSELSIRLEIDGRYVGPTANAAGVVTPVLLKSLIAGATFYKAKAEIGVEHTLSLLTALNEVASVCFQMLLISEPTDLGTTELGAGCEAALIAAGVNADDCISPGSLYRSVCIRLVSLERELETFSLDRLKADMHLQRLQMLKTASNFLSDQAKRILDEEFVGSDDFLPGHHSTEIELTQCAAAPFTAIWPQRFLYREERAALEQAACA
jgi:hypothetical protein